MPLANEPAMVDRSGTGIVATAFRDDHSAEKVTLSNLSFEGCRLASPACFELGERLRLHVRGQGLIEAKVRSVSDGTLDVVFISHCAV